MAAVVDRLAQQQDGAAVGGRFLAQQVDGEGERIENRVAGIARVEVVERVRNEVGIRRKAVEQGGRAVETDDGDLVGNVSDHGIEKRTQIAILLEPRRSVPAGLDDNNQSERLTVGVLLQGKFLRDAIVGEAEVAGLQREDHLPGLCLDQRGHQHQRGLHRDRRRVVGGLIVRGGRRGRLGSGSQARGRRRRTGLRPKIGGPQQGWNQEKRKVGENLHPGKHVRGNPSSVTVVPFPRRAQGLVFRENGLQAIAATLLTGYYEMFITTQERSWRETANPKERFAGEYSMIANTMQALVKTGPAHARMEMREAPVPQIGPADVLIAVETASVCGTDLHIYEWDEWAQERIRPPYIPGHEFCGTVVAAGDRVQGIAVGDFVSAEMHVACGHCLQCRSGQAHVCQFVKILGVDADGAFADFVRIPASNVWKFGPAIPREFGSLFDPFGNAVHTVLSGAIAGQTVAVTGCGPIGLFSIAVARACGAARIFAIEPNAGRRNLASTMGADVLLDPARPGGRPDEVEVQVRAATGGNGVDVLLEMSGHPSAIRQGFRLLRMGGRASLLGIPSRPVELDLANALIFKGATVHGINGRRMYETWFQAEALLRQDGQGARIDLTPVITHRLPLAEFAEAMHLLSSGQASKILLKVNAGA